VVYSLLRRLMRRLSAIRVDSRRPGFLQELFQEGSNSPSRKRHGFRPGFESLEQRLTPSVSFANQQTLGAGTKAYAAVTADFNGDGKPDLAVVNFGSNDVSVILNTTTPGATTASFAAQVTFAVGTGPIALVVADFNGDGKPDLAVVNSTSNTVSVLLNTTANGATTPTFAAQVTFAVGAGPISAVAADINGDGKPDLAVVNNTDNTASVLLNTTANGATTPTFSAQQTFAVGTTPFSVTAGDINGDGKPDLVVANTGNNNVGVLLNTTATNATTASFAAQQTFAVGSNPFAVAVGDFNLDGKPDIAVANAGANNVGVLLNMTATNATTASFAAQQTFAVGKAPEALFVKDFDGDGRPDLAIANSQDNNVSVLTNATQPGTSVASFNAQQTFALGGSPFSVVSADFNGDSRPDLAAASFNDNTASVLLNSTAPVVVGQFGTHGVQQYIRATNSWIVLTGANAKLLASDSQGSVVAEFPGAGVWLFTPSTSWRQINGVDATALAMDPYGNVAATFPGFGVGQFLVGSGWHISTGAIAKLLAMDGNGDIAGEFPGAGVWLFKPSTGWKQINGIDATLLTMNASGAIAANFPTFGVGEFQPASGWSILNGTQATALAIDQQANVYATFQGFGVAKIVPGDGGGTILTAAIASLLGVAVDGTLVGEFPGHGIWELNPFVGWFQINTADASLLTVA
jgi:hypothetical protein